MSTYGPKYLYHHNFCPISLDSGPVEGEPIACHGSAIRILSRHQLGMPTVGAERPWLGEVQPASRRGTLFHNRQLENTISKAPVRV